MSTVREVLFHYEALFPIANYPAQSFPDSALASQLLLGKCVDIDFRNAPLIDRIVRRWKNNYAHINLVCVPLKNESKNFGLPGVYIWEPLACGLWHKLTSGDIATNVHASFTAKQWNPK